MMDHRSRGTRIECESWPGTNGTRTLSPRFSVPPELHERGHVDQALRQPRTDRRGGSKVVLPGIHSDRSFLCTPRRESGQLASPMPVPAPPRQGRCRSCTLPRRLQPACRPPTPALPGRRAMGPAEAQQQRWSVVLHRAQWSGPKRAEVSTIARAAALTCSSVIPVDSAPAMTRTSWRSISSTRCPASSRPRVAVVVGSAPAAEASPGSRARW